MGDKDVRIVGKVVGEALRIPGLDGEVELTLERAAQLTDDLDGQVAPCFGHLLLDEVSQVRENSEIRMDLRLDAGAADLQDHSRPVRKFRPVHLCDRGRREGLAFKVVEHLEGRAAERLLDLRHELVEGDRRHLVMQFSEFGGPRRRQQVLPRREHLAEFDEGRPEFLERKPDALLRFKMSDVARFAPMQDLAGALEQRDDAGATHHIAQPMPDQDRADLAQAWQVPDRAGDAPDHER